MKPLLVLGVLLLVAGCRTSQPPVIGVCILDGFGAADCVEADGSKKIRLSSEMANYWATSQPDMAKFSSWCYDAPQSAVKPVMTSIAKNAHDQ